MALSNKVTCSSDDAPWLQTAGSAYSRGGAIRQSPFSFTEHRRIVSRGRHIPSACNFWTACSDDRTGRVVVGEVPHPIAPGAIFVCSRTDVGLRVDGRG